MRLHILGARGSRPVSGAEHLRFGGATSCVMLAHDGAAPSLVLDAGTGLASAGSLLGGAAFDGSILLSHLHWDHVFGLPFFRSGDRDDARVDLWMPAQGDAEAVLAGSMSPPHFPIRPSELNGQWTFHALEPGTHLIEGFDVLALDIPHKGGRTFGYRVRSGDATVAYLPDHGPVEWGDGPDGLGVQHEAALRLAAGVDVLLHDAQHTTPEFEAVRGYGHAAMEYAVSLGAAAGARRVVLFHHDPSRTDDELDEIERSFSGAGVEVRAAREGEELVLPLR